MQSVTIEEARTQLADLIRAAVAGEEVLIRTGEELAVQLVPRAPKKRTRQFGSARNLITMEPDFDEPLEEFGEYMP